MIEGKPTQCRLSLFFLKFTLMKKSGLFLLAALLFAFVSCEEKPVQPEAATLTVSPTELSFTADDSSNKLLLVTTTAAWTANASQGWIHLDKISGNAGGSVTVTVDANEGTDDRTGTISFTGAQSATVKVTQSGSDIRVLEPIADAFDGNKRASTTYQLLIYSFADSDGDGVGDFRGIQDKLDYLDGLGVTALWLSPAHPTSSYHGYDVDDYNSVSLLYGGQTAFENLVNAAHEKGIKIYMDFVLNHSGRNNEWFKSVKQDPENSPYRDYYVLSKNPAADASAGKIDNYGGGKDIGMGGWFSLGDGNIGYKGRLHFKVQTSGGKPSKVTVTKTDEAVTGSVSDASLWIYAGNPGKDYAMKKTADNVFELVADIDTPWGFLVRTVSGGSWPDGSKYGGPAGSSTITFGEPLSLTATNPQDITFGSTTYYMGSFGESMPDLNYGPYTSCEESAAFKSTVEAATKWVNLGVDGFRLDAVLWVYQAQIKANQRFLDQWYRAVNKAYKDAGHSDDIFMVGEAWEGHGTEKQYYKGLISNFEFEYFGQLAKAVGGNAGSYVSSVSGYISDHEAQRSDAITSIFMTNHDQDRAAESFGKNIVKEKQAAAMMLTTSGKPFIYQGEELGYWGKTEKGDPSRRQPMAWDKSLSSLCKFGLSDNHKSDLTDYKMVTGSISVEAQEADAASLLNVYKTWSRLRNTYPALAEGKMSEAPANGGAVASWYMTSTSGQKMLVIHNCGSAEKSITVNDDISKPVAVLGTVKADRKTLIVSGNSSIVFLL